MGSKKNPVVKNPVINWREVVRFKRELKTREKEVANGDGN